MSLEVSGLFSRDFRDFRYRNLALLIDIYANTKLFLENKNSFTKPCLLNLAAKFDVVQLLVYSFSKKKLLVF